MRKIIPLKLTSLILFVVILTATITCVCENAHAAESRLPAAGELTSHQECATASDPCPSCPLDQRHDNNDCDTCADCACHASLTIQQFQLSHTPLFFGLNASEPFKYLPEVYLSKFIPPQNQA